MTGAKAFRAELVKIMPGYKWTIKRPKFADVHFDGHFLEAIGVQSAGFNRTSTLCVFRMEKGSIVTYRVKSAGFGKASPWIAEREDVTLARALRGLQDYYERQVHKYNGAVMDLTRGRKREVKRRKDE